MIDRWQFSLKAAREKLNSHYSRKVGQRLKAEDFVQLRAHLLPFWRRWAQYSAAASQANRLS
jgi:hypothetical protein